MLWYIFGVDSAALFLAAHSLKGSGNNINKQKPVTLAGLKV